MKKTLSAAIIVLATSGTATAGGEPGSIGVGGEFQLSGIGGLSVNYDAGQFHVGGFLGFIDEGGPDNSIIDIGARFFYHIASTATSDFGLGGSFGIGSEDNPAPGERQTLVFLEPSFQIRAFIVSNVALSFTAGLTIGAVDADEVAITGSVNGGAGVHYYF